MSRISRHLLTHGWSRFRQLFGPAANDAPEKGSSEAQPGPAARGEQKHPPRPRTPESQTPEGQERFAERHRAPREPDETTKPFWNRLDSIELDAFRAVASNRTFATGARLITEGDEAHSVIVILSGRTKICVDRNGTERVIAERGPGQLVGERAVFELKERSASVIAVEPVQALVVRITDFVSFLNAHRRVGGIVMAQLNDRYVEDQAWSRPGSLDYLPDPGPGFGPWHGENCTIILSDVAEFGARNRTDDDRRIIRESLSSMTRTALLGLGSMCSWEDRGDGLLTIVPPNVPTSLVIRHLYKELPAALVEHNRAHRDPARIRVRVAVNVGPVTTDSVGVSGESIIVTARMVEAPVLKQKMKGSQASLGIIVSEYIHDTVIRHDLSLSGFAPVQVDVKESRFPAQMKLFGTPGEPDAPGRDWRRLIVSQQRAQPGQGYPEVRLGGGVVRFEQGQPAQRGVRGFRAHRVGGRRSHEEADVGVLVGGLAFARGDADDHDLPDRGVWPGHQVGQAGFLLRFPGHDGERVGLTRVAVPADLQPGLLTLVPAQ
jgi:hypothetical protein